MDHDKMMQIIYDVFIPTLPRLAPGDDVSTRRALEMLYGAQLEGVGEDFRVLDIGCGGGFFAIPAAVIVGKTGKVYGIDASQRLIAGLKVKAAAHGLKGSSATLGATKLSALCLEMEMKGKDGDMDGAEELLEKIEEAIETAKSDLHIMTGA